MTNEKEDDGVLELSDLEYYIVIGVRKDDKEPVMLVSPNVSVPDMGAMLGRANAIQNLQIAQAGVHQYTEYMRAKAKKPPIQIVPGVGGLKQ